MSDEKTLFNKNIDKDENSVVEDKQKHAIAKEEEPDFVDFSSAFDEDDEEKDFEEYDEEYEESRSVSPLVKGFSFFKKKKNNYNNRPIEDNETEEVEEIVQPVKEEKDEPKLQTEEYFDESVTDAEEDEVVEEKQSKKEKKVKGFPFFSKKEDEPDFFEKEESEVDEESAEQAIQEKTVGEIIEIPEDPEETIDEIIIVLDDVDEKTEKTIDSGKEEIVFIEDFQEETEIPVKETVVELSSENEPVIEEQKPEQGKFSRFAFLNKKDASVQMEKPVVENDVQEETAEKTEKPGFEILLSFEDSVPDEEKIKQSEDVAESKKVLKEETIEEILPFEATVVENTTEENVEQAKEPETKKKKKEKKKKIPKEKKEKKTKEIKESTNEQDEESTVSMMTMKDHLTFILIILALLLTIAFVCVKFLPFGNNNTQNSGVVIEPGKKVSEIQIQREGASGHFIQSDIDNVFYAYSSEYKLAYYQCNNNKMIPIQPTGTVEAVVELGQDKLPVKVDYVQKDSQLFGTGVFRATENQGNYYHSMVVFKLVNLPKGYEQEGKALLLATSNTEAVSQSCNIWTDSYIVDLVTGKTTRFLTSDNSIYSTGYSTLTDEGYASTNGRIPFFTTRESDVTTNKKDIYLKADGKESLFAKDVAGSFVFTDGDVVSYLKVTDTGFNVIRKEDDKESVVFSLHNNTSYLYHNEYLLDKYNGNLYNVKTGEEVAVEGYGMSNPEMMVISNDGRYLVVLGTVNSAIDYQVHIFDLKTNKYAKYEDDNFSQHKNLAFANNTTIVYSAVEPNQGYEYVMLDVSKAIK